VLTNVCEFESRSAEVYSIQHVFKSVVTPVSSTNKTDRHDITKVLLKVALNTITLPLHLKCSSESPYGG
jgi:hypothetical protein